MGGVTSVVAEVSSRSCRERDHPKMGLMRLARIGADRELARL